MQTKHKPYGPYEKYFKRPIDFFCGLAAIVVFWWLYLIIAILVRVKIGSPVLFTQDRPGKGERIFKLYKFRTMTNQRGEDGELLPDEVRLTKFGKILRATSLDELPEVFNIIKGDMSIIGPRPLIPSYLPYYTTEEKKRHDVRPGLSGLAQINGRSFISWEEIFEYDIQYVKQITFLRDVGILLKTVEKVFKHENVADISEAVKDEQGRYHCLVNGEDYILHQPMNIERESTNVEGNRK